MKLRRRTLLAGVTAGIASVSGCIAEATNTASGCASLPPDDAKSPAEIRAALPTYEEAAADDAELRDRATEIQSALFSAVREHPWTCGMGLEEQDGETNIVVFATCRPRAERYIPDEWGGVTIQVRQKFCGDFELH